MRCPLYKVCHNDKCIGEKPIQDICNSYISDDEYSMINRHFKNLKKGKR